jgi:hypothetical protein
MWEDMPQNDRHLRSALDDFLIDRGPREAPCIVDFQSIHDMLPKFFDRFDAEVEISGDWLVPLPLRQSV